MLTTTYDGAERPSTVSGSLNGNATNYLTKSAYWPQGGIYYFVRGNGLWSAAGYNDRLQPSEFYEAVNNVDSPSNMLFYSCLDWGVTENFNNSLYQLCNPANTHNDNGTLLHYGEYDGGPGSSQYLSFTQTFTYDGANRLATASEGSNWSRNFGYDQYGNMWVAGNSGNVPLAGNTPQSPSSFNANNQITTGNASFDAAGNQTVVNGDTLAYDAENRMISAYDPIMHSTETYVYDGNGQRVQKSGPGGTTTYVYDAFGNLAAEYGAAPSAPCTTCYLSYDHLGSVRLVTDQNANVVSRHDYLPFGEEIPANTAGRNGQWGSTSDVDTKFTGQIRDTETGMDYFNARYFTNALGRFNSPDPANAGADMTDPESWNGYSYVADNPLNATDPDGLSSVVFNGGTHSLYVIPSDPNATEGHFCAANNVDHRDSIGKLVDGTYYFLDTTRPHPHFGAAAAESGAFGPGGIFRILPFVGAHGLVHRGVGIHAGRLGRTDLAGRPGVLFATNGCIRTTDTAITYITNLAAHDPLTTLTVVNNRPSQKATVKSTISYGPVVSGGGPSDVKSTIHYGPVVGGRGPGGRPGYLPGGGDEFDWLQLLFDGLNGGGGGGHRSPENMGLSYDP